ncbi:MAG: hypothetical protein ACYSUF_02205 [Planctomycetota bacterium]|jgi:type II secretory pathway pseudopilin PulG
MTRHRRDAFSIVEMLIVMGVLALLLSLLLPSLSGVHKHSLKSRELHALRQVGNAWIMYANGHDQRLLLGFMGRKAQEHWGLKYEYPDGSPIPPAPSYAENEPNLAGPWTWRLLPYFEWSHAVVHSYRDEPEFDATRFYRDEAESEAIAHEPGFAYNAFYLGGWWDYVILDGWFVCRNAFQNAAYADGRRVNVTDRSMSNIKRPMDVVAFCSSAKLAPGLHRKVRDDIAGSHYVVPPMLAVEGAWSIPGSRLHDGDGVAPARGESSPPGAKQHSVTPGSYDPSSIVVEGEHPVPVGRYNRLIAVLYADGRTAGETPGSLHDMRKWIDAADRRDFQHTFTGDP